MIACGVHVYLGNSKPYPLIQCIVNRSAAWWQVKDNDLGLTFFKHAIHDLINLLKSVCYRFA